MLIHLEVVLCQHGVNSVASRPCRGCPARPAAGGVPYGGHEAAAHRFPHPARPAEPHKQRDYKIDKPQSPHRRSQIER